MPQPLPSSVSSSRSVLLSTASPAAEESFLKWARQAAAKLDALEAEVLAPPTGKLGKQRGKEQKEKELLRKIKASQQKGTDGKVC